MPDVSAYALSRGRAAEAVYLFSCVSLGFTSRRATGNTEAILSELPFEMFDHYDGDHEAQRLSQGAGELERIRTQNLIARGLPAPPAIVLDIGGAAGVHGLWLARLGYAVHLIDAVPRHVEQARAASSRQSGYPLASCATGDARHLEFHDAGADVVLLLGPLYHLTERQDRLQALTEAYRVLRPGGVLFAAGISRFASFLSGMSFDLLVDPAFVEIVRQDLTNGQHRNPTNNPRYFTTAFFHHPDELKAELEFAGFSVEKIAAIEGPVEWMRSFEQQWRDAAQRALLLEFLRMCEEEPAIVATGSHFLGVGRR
jgi:ubiquinone/menaquinone biosynthesis C-methylase UbiE